MLLESVVFQRPQDCVNKFINEDGTSCNLSMHEFLLGTANEPACSCTIPDT